MSGSRFHPYLSSQDERLAALAASTTYLQTPFPPYSVINQTDITTQSILNASHFPPQPLAPYQAISTPYTLLGGTGWQPGVGMPASKYWPRDHNLPELEQKRRDPNLLAMEQQRLAVQQQQRMEAHNMYMADRSQEYIRYMDQLRLISSASLPAVATVHVLPTLPDPLSSPPPIQDHPLNLSLKDRFEDSTRGSSELSSTRSTFTSTSSASMSMEKSTGSKTSPEPSLVKLSNSNAVKLAHPKKRSYQSNSEKSMGPDTLSPEPSLVRLSGPMISSSSSKKQSQPSAENPSLKLIGSEKGFSEPFPGRIKGSDELSPSKRICSEKPLLYKSSSTIVIDFKKTSSEKSKKSTCPSSDPSTRFAVKIHPTKAIEVEGLEPEVSSMFPYLEATDMGTIVLWNFLWALLKDSNYRQVLRWIDQPTLKFEVIQPQDLARLWGIVKKNTSMNLDKLMKTNRSLDMPTPIGSPRRPVSDSRVPGSPLAEQLQLQKLKRQALYKKSPVAKSPLRDVLKARCQGRIRDNRAKLLDGKRGIQEAIRDEVASWRGAAKSLTFTKGFSDDEIEAAFEDLELIEAELLLEEYGIDVRGDIGVEKLLDEGICPVCQLGKVTAKGGYVSCSAACGYSIEWEDSVAEWVKLLESSVEEHSAKCGDALGFLAPPPGSSIMAMCQTCDYCRTVVGQ